MSLPAIKRKQTGFTLIELLIVVAIIAILISIGLASYSRVQKSARDSQRKSDLRNVASALEQLYGDYNKYPPAASNKIKVFTGNPSDCVSTGTGSTTLDWGTGRLKCGWPEKIYLSQLPKDPLASQFYRYAICDANQQVYAIFTDLEVNPNPALPTPPGGCSFAGTEDYYVTSQD